MKSRLGYVDGLRALAVVSVAVFHAQVHLYGPGPSLARWAKECAHGVDLFFVVSGFCLAHPTLAKLAQSGSVRFDAAGYALKRFLRILPPYALAVALAALVAASLSAAGVALPEGMRALDASGVLQNLLFLDKPHEYVNSSFWTLGIEFRWYFVFPFALALAVRNLRAFVAVIILVALASELTAASSIDLGCLPAFLLGIVAAAVSIQGSAITRFALPLCAAAAGFGLLNEARPHFPLQTNVGWHAAAFFFVAAAGAWPWLRRALEAAPLRRIGIASYSIYLVHEPIVSATATALRPSLGAGAAAATAVVAGVAAGFAFWAVIERPLTDPGFVATFVERGRGPMLELFTIAGAPPSFELRSTLVVPSAVPAPQPPLLAPFAQEAV